MEKIGAHPLAEIFPLMEGYSFSELVEDIRVNGLREPIILFEGQILDGRNRARACHAAQVAARYKEYDGRDALAFVVSANLHRRHLDASQRAMIAAQLVTLNRGRGAPKKDGRRDKGGRLLPPLKTSRAPVNGPVRKAGQYSPGADVGVTAERAGEILNVSGATVRIAQQVLTTGSKELIESVKSGEASVFAAAEFARLPKAQQTAILSSDGPQKVKVIGASSRRGRLDHRRVNRAADGSSQVAVFDHFKIGDGRSIGNVRAGEIDHVIESLELVVVVLRAIPERFANLSSGDRVRDVVSAGNLQQIIADAREKRTTADRAS